jgi:hypothetical protein
MKSQADVLHIVDCCRMQPLLCLQVVQLSCDRTMQKILLFVFWSCWRLLKRAASFLLLLCNVAQQSCELHEILRFCFDTKRNRIRALMCHNQDVLSVLQVYSLQCVRASELSAVALTCCRRPTDNHPLILVPVSVVASAVWLSLRYASVHQC